MVSESLDRKLPLWRRIGVWMHLSMCRLCSEFRKDVRRLRAAAGEEAGVPDAKLSDEARQRIQNLLNNQDG